MSRGHELTFTVGLGREHGLIEEEDLCAREKVHAQVLARYRSLPIDSKLGLSINQLLYRD